MNYEELKADIIKIGLTNRYEVVLYVAALGYDIKPYIISLIERLYNEGIVKE